MTTVFKSKSGAFRVYSKGAPDVLIDLCKWHVSKSGQLEAIQESFFSELKEKQKQFACSSLRTLLIAYKEINPIKEGQQLPADADLESDLIVLGMVGIQDPLRPGIAEAVQTCKNAGVTVRMVTGDNVDTAIAISKEAGIIDKDFRAQDNVYTVMEGKRFREKVLHICFMVG